MTNVLNNACSQLGSMAAFAMIGVSQVMIFIIFPNIFVAVPSQLFVAVSVLLIAGVLQVAYENFQLQFIIVRFFPLFKLFGLQSVNRWPFCCRCPYNRFLILNNKCDFVSRRTPNNIPYMIQHRLKKYVRTRAVSFVAHLLFLSTNRLTRGLPICNGDKTVE